MGIKPTLLFFGFIRPYKGLKVLLSAMPEINRRSGAILRVVGEPWGEQEDTLSLLTKLELNDIVALDLRYIPMEEIGAIFSSAHLVVLPYRSATGC